MGRVLTEEDFLFKRSKLRSKINSISSELFYLQIVVILIALFSSLLLIYDNDAELVFNGIFGGFIGLFFYLGSLRIRLNSEAPTKVKSSNLNKAIVKMILRDGLPENCLILNELEVQGRDRLAELDHLVISPTGLFVI